MNHIVKKYGTTVDLSRQGKFACPRCRKNGQDNSGDNLEVYGLDREGRHRGAFCFACDYVIPSEEWLEENGGEEYREEEWSVVGRPFDEEIHEELKEQTTFRGSMYRGIKDAISKAYGVRYAYDEESGEVYESYYPCTQEYKLSGYKIRRHPKEFVNPFGETGRDCELFGQWRFKDVVNSYVLITAGEVDCLSAAQMLHTDQERRGKTEFGLIPVVSSTIGESGSHKQIQQQYDWLEKQQKIVICPDNDEAGRKAVEKIAKVVPKGKLYVMSIPLKDANEMLAAGREREFVNAFYKAPAYTPVGIVGSGELMSKIVDAAKVEKIPLPPFMHKVQKLMAGGIPLKTIVNLGAASGAGKSTFAGELVYYWVFNSPHKVGIVSLEDDCAQYGTKMLSRHMGRKIDLIEDIDEKLEYLDSLEVQAASGELFFTETGEHRFNLVDDRDGTLEDIKEKIQELVIACDCRVIILDPLQDVLDGLSNEEQAVFMKWLKGMVKSHDVTFININHVRKSSEGGKANSAGAELFEEAFQGSSSIFKSAACNLLFMRNKEAESEFERNITRMKMTKCRWSGVTAPIAGMYYYCNDEHTMYDVDDYLDKHPELRDSLGEEED